MMGMKRILLVFAMVLVLGCQANRKPQPETKEVVAVNPEPTKAAAEKLITDPIVEKAIRKSLKKPTGDLTKADLEKVTMLGIEGFEKNNQLTDVPEGLENLPQLWYLSLSINKLTDVKGLENLTQLEELKLDRNQLTDVKGLENLTHLKELYLQGNPDLTKAQIDELQKALPKCKIEHNAKE